MKKTEKVIRINKIKSNRASNHQKVVNATQNMQKMSKTRHLKFYMVLSVTIIIIVASISLFIISLQIKNGSFYFSKKEINSKATDLNTAIDDSSTDSSEDEKNESNLLQYVNYKHPLDSQFVPKLVEYDGHLISPLMQEDLTEMLKSAENDGISLNIDTAYVSYEEQQKRYEESIEYYMTEMNYSSVKAEAATMKLIQSGESCEHRTGLNLTFSDQNEGNTLFEESKAYDWLSKNAVKFGFVRRYTKEFSQITGMNESFTEFRYVGVENAKKMTSLNMCLEQYSDTVNFD